MLNFENTTKLGDETSELINLDSAIDLHGLSTGRSMTLKQSSMMQQKSQTTRNQKTLKILRQKSTNRRYQVQPGEPLEFKTTSTQTDPETFYLEMKEHAEKEWKFHLSAATRLKFERLKVVYQDRMRELFDEIRKEKEFREHECYKAFQQWHENINLQCTLFTTQKLPPFALGLGKGYNAAPTKRDTLKKMEEMIEDHEQ